MTVPYQGTGPAMTDLIGGQVDFMCDQTTNTTGQILGGEVKAYAVTSPERLANLPDLPTTAEAGLPDFQLGIWHGLYAPAGTPPEVLGQAQRGAEGRGRRPDRRRALRRARHRAGRARGGDARGAGEAARRPDRALEAADRGGRRPWRSSAAMDRAGIKDILSGLIFLGFGLAFGFAATGYEIGTAFRMGPGYFPLLLAGALALLGVAIIVKGVTAAAADGADRPGALARRRPDPRRARLLRRDGPRPRPRAGAVRRRLPQRAGEPAQRAGRRPAASRRR